uniref:Integral membrane protein n=1 Tax=Streptomyces sp. NBC_01393 TaxID=2903851 RepID=A0AAU3HWI3_9ACTN
MSKRQIRKMFRLMAQGQAVQLASPMASVKKLARLAFIAQQFGYEYADVRQGAGRNNALTMLIVPDPGPQAQARAAQNWAQYPKAGDGVSLPPVVPDALELLKARINFDLTGKNAEKRMVYAGIGLSVGCVVLAVRAGGDSVAFTVAGVLWAVMMVVLGVGLVVTRKRNAKFAALLGAAGFAPVTEEGGRVRYLPPTAGYAGRPTGPYGPYAPHAGQAPQAPYPGQAPYGGQVPQAAQPPYAGQAPQAPHAGQVPYPAQAPQAPYPGQAPYGGQPPQAPGLYAQQPPVPAPGGPGNPYAAQPGPVPPQPQPPQ